MTETEKTFLRSILAAQYLADAKSQAMMYADWLDEQLKPRVAARWRRTRRPKTLALRAFVGDKSYPQLTWLISNQGLLSPWRGPDAAAAYNAKILSETTGLEFEVARIPAVPGEVFGVRLGEAWCAWTHQPYRHCFYAIL